MYVVLYHVFSLVALCLFFFNENKTALYLPYDGTYMQQLFKFYFEWSTPTTNLVVSPLQGLGGITFPLNYWFSPASVFSFAVGGSTVNSVTFYTILAIEFFLSTMLLAHALGVTRRIALNSSWVG